MTWAVPGTIRLPQNSVVEDAVCVVLVGNQLGAFLSKHWLLQPKLYGDFLSFETTLKRIWEPWYISPLFSFLPTYIHTIRIIHFAEMIGVNSVQSTSKVRVRATGSVKYPREDTVWRQTHRSKSMKISNSTEFSAKEAKVNKQTGWSPPYVLWKQIVGESLHRIVPFW